MPTVTNDGVALYYETDGGGEPVAFLADLGYGAWSWAWQHPAVAGPFEAVVADTRGAGRSAAPPGPYAVADLAADVEAVLADAGARRAHLVGAGLGGMVALRYAVDHGRARSLSLLGTAATGTGLSLATSFAAPGDDAALLASLRHVLSAGFLAEHPEAVDRMLSWRREEDAAPDAWRAQAAAMAGFDCRNRLHEVGVPALVVHGGRDRVVPAGRGERLAADLPRGRFERFPDAGHLVGVERSGAVNDLLVGFLEAHAGAE